MSIPESQLETWSHQGLTKQFTNTYAIIKSLLHNGSAPYANRSFNTFLQGSYANDTNVYGDSDVDTVILTDSVYYSDLEGLSEEDKKLFNESFTRAEYQLSDFKNDVLSWLIKNYSGSVKPGKKAIFVEGNGGRRDADVLPCAEFRRYQRFKGAFDETYVKGICFFASDGTRIENFPKQHSENCTTKHQDTKSWFKPTVRIYKNLRNKLIADGVIADDLAPSYFIEGLLYNVPTHRFGGTEQANFRDTLDWLVAADRNKFVCANEQFYLLNDFSPVTWRADKCQRFLNAAVGLWNDW